MDRTGKHSSSFTPEYVSTYNKYRDKMMNDCEEKVTQWKKFHNDYKTLEERLDTLPDKVSYDIMVPFGKYGMIPGKLVHTNEITVLLGDNWFLERSAKQANEIIARRIKHCESMLSKLYQEKDQLQNWRSFISEFAEESTGGETVEIIEDYDPEKEKQWREKHKESVRRERKAQQSKIKTENNEDYWAHLELMEKQETQTEICDQKQMEIPEKIKNSKSKKVQWSTGNTSTLEVAFSDDPNNVNAVSNEKPHGIISPSDIYNLYSSAISESKPQTSILKNKHKVIRETISVPSNLPAQTHPVTERESVYIEPAFSETVIEKNVKTNPIPIEEKRLTDKPKSKFKVERIARSQ